MKEEIYIIVKTEIYNKRFTGMKCVKVRSFGKADYYRIEESGTQLYLKPESVRKLTKLDKALE